MSTAMAVPEVRIRPFRPEDLDVLAGFWRDMASDPLVSDRIYPPTEENVARWRSWVLKVHEEEGDHVLVAEAEGVGPVGFVLFRSRVERPLWTPRRTAIIYDLYVRPDWRRRGIGTALLEEAMKIVMQEGATHVRISVLADNEPALRLYKKLGFREYMITLDKGLK